MPPAPPFDLVIGGVPRFAAEAPWAWRLLRRYATRLACATRTELPGRRPTVADVRGGSPFVLVQVDPESYLPPHAAERLLAGLARDGADVVLPVSNEPWTEEARAAPAFAYTTPSQLEEAVVAAARGAGARFAASDPRSPVFALRRETLARFSPTDPLDEIPARAGRAGCSVSIDPGAYLHRYGAMDAQAREDLAERVPAGARSVLDVGCSRGASAAALRARGVTRLVGIEPDAEDAAGAAGVYDQVIARPLEEVEVEVEGEGEGEVGEDFTNQFDAVLFGDVLEHLVDPAQALLRVRPWLSETGVVIASVPNFGHWAVVADLIEGRFEYVPYSTLSGTHIRFFTRRTLHDLFGACGYAVDRVDTVVLPPSPAGEQRLARLAAMPGACADLKAVEFIVVARKDG